MVFNSIHFFLFFPVIALAFFGLPHRFRTAFLLVASCYFYMALIPGYILILFVTILIDYFAGILIEKASGARRKWYLGMSLAGNLGMLSIFKYSNFFCQNISWLARLQNPAFATPVWDFVLPLGLSFHTFQAMGYTIDVYRGEQAAEKRLDRFALFVLFFPQLVAGPIERAKNLLVQFGEEKVFDSALATSGLRLALFGLFQKVFVADRLALIVNDIYNAKPPQSAAPLCVATFAFSIQIYCDFCGYSNMAVGLARVLGFRLSENFRQPYFAISATDFWKRWHISLTSWFRDYLYKPLGGSRRSSLLHVRNILLVFCLSGLWHGANWTFVIWGLYHAVWYLSSQKTESFRKAIADRAHWSGHPLQPLVRNVVTFLIVTVGWIFFRANTLPAAFNIIRNIFNPFAYSIDSLKETLQHRQVWLTCVGIAGVWLVEKLDRTALDQFALAPVWARWGAYLAVLLCLFNFGAIADIPFIYFQF